MIDNLVQDIEKTEPFRVCPECGEPLRFAFDPGCDEDIYETEEAEYHEWYTSWECTNEETDCDYPEIYKDDNFTGYFLIEE